MDQISLNVLKTKEGMENVQIIINDENLIEVLKRIEIQYDKKIAGQYIGLLPEVVFSPSRHFLGITNENLDYHDDKSAILICECGVAGCWDFIVKITISDETVTWSDFEQPHRGPESASGYWNYKSLIPFVFDRRQYESQLTKINL